MAQSNREKSSQAKLSHKDMAMKVSHRRLRVNPINSTFISIRICVRPVLEDELYLLKNKKDILLIVVHK